MKKNRQAVVVIHGIGEQRPMRTLRAFVTSLLNYEKYIGDDDNYKQTWWIKPNRIDQSYELRKITAASKSNVRSTTHFYEYHWAPNMRDTKWHHIWGWIKSMLFRIPENVSIRLTLLWILTWFILLFWGFFSLIKIFSAIGLCSSSEGSHFLLQPVCAFLDTSSVWTPYWTTLILPIGILIIFSKIVTGFIGDAARYLVPKPENIKQREIIRKNGIDLIRKLQEKDEYERIILVGHSLGSVIAYDILTYLWIDYNKQFEITEEVLNIQKKLVQASRNLRKNPLTEKEQRAYEELQKELWQEINKQKVKWVVSDFITLGSPLSSAHWLMADSKAEFEQRIEEREFPTSPPQLEDDKFIYSYGENQAFHHASPFSVTKWSNIYYPGDIIGGELSSNFGLGIRDIPIKYKGGFLKKHILSFINPLSHNHYWSNNTHKKTIDQNKEFNAIEKIYSIAGLNDLEKTATNDTNS